MTVLYSGVADQATAAATRTTDQTIHALIADRVNEATAHYKAGRPGRGEYVLTRLGVTLARLTNDRSSAEQLAAKGIGMLARLDGRAGA